MAKIKTSDSILDAKHDGTLFQKAQEKPDDYVVVSFENEFGAVKVFNKEDVSPKELGDVGKLLAEQFINEVLNPSRKLWVEFIEKYELIPSQEVTVSASASMMSYGMRQHLKSMISHRLNEDN